MWRTAGVLLLLCLGGLSSTEASEVSLELAGTVGFPVDVLDGDYQNSLGGVATVIFGPVPFGVGAGIGYDEFKNKSDDGSVAFTTLFVDIRLPIVRAERLGVFGVVAPELAFTTISFSEEAQAANSLIPPSETDVNIGLALGTGVSLRLAGEWLSFISTQKVHFILDEAGSNMLFVVSFGIALSN